MSGALEHRHLQQLCKGDLNSFKWVYLKYHRSVYGLCRCLINDEQVVEEITEDVFVRLWIKRATIDPDRGVSGLLFRMTRDYAWNYLKKRSRRSQLQEAFVLDNSAAQTLPKAEAKLILEDYLAIAEQGIQLLPEKRRQAFSLRYRDGLNNREIARRLRISEVTVRVHLSKAMQFLRDYLEAHPDIRLPLLLFTVGHTYVA